MSHPNRVLADIWNAAMKRLGYVRRAGTFVLPKRLRGAS
jgi:hypothetical protein